jgi:hypothetical protein
MFVTDQVMGVAILWSPSGLLNTCTLLLLFKSQEIVNVVIGWEKAYMSSNANCTRDDLGNISVGYPPSRL